MSEIKLYNGDCLEVMKQIPDKSIDLVLTDPPYQYLKNQKLDIPFDEKIYFNEINRVTKDDSIVVMFGRGTSFYRWNCELANRGFKFKEEIIWNKRRPSGVYNPISRIHETISIYAKGNAKVNKVLIQYIESKQYDVKSIIQDIKRIKTALNNEKSLDNILNYLDDGNIKLDRNKKIKFCISTGELKGADRSVETVKIIKNGLKEKDIIECLTEQHKMQHPTQKPIRLLERLLELTSKENNVVLDTFMGSGSTGIACINTNRNFIGIELDKEYFNIAKERIAKFEAQGNMFDILNKQTEQENLFKGEIE